MRRRHLLTSLLVVLLGGCGGIGEEFRGADVEVLLSKPMPEEAPVTPIEETNLLAFDALRRALGEAHERREEVIEERYDGEDHEDEGWHWIIAAEPLDEGTYQELREELHSYPEHVPRDNRASGRYVRYESEVYVLRIVKVE